MAFDLKDLQNYSDEQSDKLIVRTAVSGPTLDKIRKQANVETGIKTEQKINRLGTDVVFQDGDGCGFKSADTTKLTQRSIVVGNMKVNEELCIRDLEKKWTQKQLPIGSDYDKIPFEQEYAELKSDAITEALEVAVWQGDKTSAKPNINKFDGFNKLIDASADVIKSNAPKYTKGAPVAEITEDNVFDVVMGVYKAIPSKLLSKSDLEIVAGWDTFRLFVLALTMKNLFHYNGDNANGEIVIPGTNTKLVALPGLDLTNRVHAFRWSNMYYGTDLDLEEDQFKFLPMESDELVKFKARWKSGVNYAYPDEMVTFKPAPPNGGN
ncbi:hypothetical protein KTO58_01255 [Chitinophaga pendula]|uniref:hypothetical protein n=1 Tax=Chitinophaga TaxID=79328 RepID=UPI000BAF6EFD|nr:MULTISPECIES: hypothetical protein [Chitinophaga]ASZ14510.1 hypothetical protein CK934_27965 [Chitinophaga sp. MD30]UCJ07833.1 hypothetical protein KTO58_01255 [Chitinophaga pendula]